MKNKLFSLGFLLLAFVLYSCPNAVLPAPTYANSEENKMSFSQTSYWGAPTNLEASQGLKGRIELSWTGVKSAYRYYVYESNSATSGKWVQCGETDSETQSFVIDDCGSGADKYFKVTAVKKNGTESAYSLTVHGTSLACPVITDIDEGTESDSMATVKWWMSNVDEDTYQSLVRYAVYCLDAAGNVIQTQALSGARTSKTEITFTGLTPHTNYNYYVEAYNITDSSDNSSEISETKNAETARRTKPNPPTDARASQGISQTEILLNFTTPERCDQLNRQTGEYDAADIYFKIFRRELGASTWTGAAEYDYLPYPPTNTDAKTAYEGTASYAAGNTYFGEDTDDPLDGIPNYVIEKEISFVEVQNLNRGLRYEFKIQSYVYNAATYGTANDKSVSADSSATTVTGWLVTTPSVTLTTNESEYGYKDGEGNVVTEEEATEKHYWYDYDPEALTNEELLTQVVDGKLHLYRASDTQYEHPLPDSEMSHVTVTQKTKDGYQQRILNTTIGAHLTFETFGLGSQYKYVVEQKICAPTGDAYTTDPWVVAYRYFDTIEELNNSMYQITAGMDEMVGSELLVGNKLYFDWRGQYKFKAFIIPESSSIPEVQAAIDLTKQIFFEGTEKHDAFFVDEAVLGAISLGLVEIDASILKNATGTIYNIADIQHPTTIDTDALPWNFISYDTAELRTTLLVTDDPDVPDASTFQVKSGYKDKIQFSWIYDETCTYSVYQTDSIGEEIEVVSTVDLESHLPADGATLTYDLPVASGESHFYTLHATRGTTIYSDSLLGQTLGTAKPEFSKKDLSYNSITIKWPAVNQATSYDIIATYKDKPADADGPQNSVLTLTPVKGTGDYGTSTYFDTSDPAWPDGLGVEYRGTYYEFTYTITDPVYDSVNAKTDASYTGKNVITSVVATNSETTDETTGSVNTYTLGPAATKTTASSGAIANKDGIYVSWKAVSGASYYWVSRERGNFDDTWFNTESGLKTDGYLVSSSGALVKAQDASGSDISSFVEVSVSNGEFVLFDKIRARSTSESTWSLNQDYIAWGDAFSYVVYPLNSANDEFDLANDEWCGDGTQAKHGNGILANIKYDKVSSVCAVGHAFGYGRNVYASKSDDPRIVTIEFDSPKGQGAKSPVLKYRPIGSTGSWITTKLVINNDGDFTMTLTGDNRCYAFEYCVDFSGRSDNPFDTYSDYLKTVFDENAPCEASAIGAIKNSTDEKWYEPLNKGYAFALDMSIGHDTSGSDATTTEYINLTPWDYDMRAMGPDSDYTIAIKNLNQSASYQPVVNLNKGNYDISGEGNNSEALKVTVAKQGNAVKITPNFNSNKEDSAYKGKVHTGVLEVLRDYRHFGKVIATRTNLDSETITASYNDIDDTNTEIEMFTYRGLTKYELGRCISLVVSDALLQCGCNSGGTNTIDGSTGQFKTTHETLTYTFAWGTEGTNYRHIFRGGLCANVSDDFVSPFTISAPQASSRAACGGIGVGGVGSDQKLCYITTNTLTVGCTVGDSSYKGSVQFEAGEMGSTGFIAQFDSTKTSYVVNIKANGQEMGSPSNNQALFKKWCAIDIGKNYSKVSGYNSAWSVYNSPWWH